MQITIITPLYNEELVIVEFYRRISAVAEGLSDYTFEFLFINDGSNDTTLDLLKDIQNGDRRVKIIDLSRNFGHQAAILAGIQNAEGDAAVIIDGDLQDPPELIPELIKNWENGNDVVYAKRVNRKGESLFKKTTAHIFYGLINFLSDTPIPSNVGDFRLIDKKVIKILCELKESNLFLRGVIPWIGFRQISVEYDREARYAGNTKYSFLKMINLALDGITSFSIKPLRFSLRMGLSSIVIGFGLILYAIIVKIINPEVVIRGWPSLLITVIFFGGIQLFTIGLLGEYVAKIYRESKGRPLYIIRDMIGIDELSTRSPHKEDK
jgi:glycosyltransferase involved in cell wall biosynthesis